jgi:hypothetical protein
MQISATRSPQASWRIRPRVGMNWHRANEGPRSDSWKDLGNDPAIEFTIIGAAALFGSRIPPRR